jgi:hypothetical protein
MKMKLVKMLTRISSRIAFLGIFVAVSTGCLPTSMQNPKSTPVDQSSTGNTAPAGGGGASDTQASTKVSLTQVGALADRNYIQNVFTDIFDSASYPSNGLHDQPGITGMYNSTLKQPNVFGHACDVDSSSSAMDCGGDRLTATKSPLMVASTTVRQLNVFAMCDHALNNSNGILSAAEKIGELTAGHVNEISQTNLPKMFSLFYRGREMNSAELQAYWGFNLTLKGPPNSFTVNQRWQSVLLMMCESPDWQIL